MQVGVCICMWYRGKVYTTTTTAIQTETVTTKSPDSIREVCVWGAEGQGTGPAPDAGGCGAGC
jgi:hypothetical protein